MNVGRNPRRGRRGGGALDLGLNGSGCGERQHLGVVSHFWGKIRGGGQLHLEHNRDNSKAMFVLTYTVFILKKAV